METARAGWSGAERIFIETQPSEAKRCGGQRGAERRTAERGGAELGGAVRSGTVLAGFWDKGTTTPGPYRTDTVMRSSFFRWQTVEFENFQFWRWGIDWVDNANRRRLCVVAGLSIDLLPLSTGAILNRRMVLTAANHLEPYMQYRQRDVRIWAQGRLGLHNSPFRYRVWRIFRILPRSNNPEHQHGPRGQHCPRHDVALVISQDQIYITTGLSYRWMYAYRATLTDPHRVLEDDLAFAGSGYEYLLHIYENYKIFYAVVKRADIVDCSKYLPKWWGKFICIKNTYGFPGLQNGGPLLDGYTLVGLGCFEIRYNEDRLFVFTDLRYYVHLIHKYADIQPGEYYEYAYPQWGVSFGWFYDGYANNRVIQTFQVKDDLYPLGK
ncbi:uncharacterized protein LOC121737879 [Aricia agestis]|uniref:uncharacterized protein LOC121737879 n=1 Tax=Aricia agestis TaxID=91739 RepID=UPI001C2054A1|nr:uncharacterized protein LOC121737879 [Aricia agestis]